MNKNYQFVKTDKKKIIVIFCIALLGFFYQASTLSLMFTNDITTEHDIRLWNGFFPWWVIFFTFTFWSNFFVFITYFIYLFFGKSKKLRNNNSLLLIVCSYISLVFLIIIFILLPAAEIEHSNVNLGRTHSALTYAALIMPHIPGPLLFIFFTFWVFLNNKKGNKIIWELGWIKITVFSLIFFILYMIMVVILNYVPIGAYYIDQLTHKKIYFDGYTVYSKFTAINPQIVIVEGNKVTGHGSYINLLYYVLVIAVLLIFDSVYYLLARKIIINYLKKFSVEKINVLK